MLLICSVAHVAHAHEVTLSAEQSIVQDLRSVASQIRHAGHRLDQTLSTNPDIVQSQLTMAQARFYRGDYSRCVQYLLAILARPALKQGTVKAELLSWLGEAYLKLGFQDAAVAAFAHAVDQPAQGRSALAHRLRRLFEEVRSPKLKAVILRAWTRYLKVVRVYDDEHSLLRYLYGRALYRVGAHSKSTELFRKLGPKDSRFVRAQYFLGVLNLRKGEILVAKDRFKSAYNAWLERDRLLREDKPTLMADGTIPKDRLTKIKVDESSPLLGDHGLLGASIRLTMARLSVRDNQLDKAWQFYRGVPPGSPDYGRAETEAVYVLSQQRSYLWAARTVTNQHVSNAYSVPAVRATLQRARYLAKGGRFESSESEFKAIEKHVERMRKDAEDSPATQAKFALSDAHEKWKTVAPASEKLHAEMKDVQELYAALSKMDSGQATLPMVSEGQRLLKALKARLVHIGEHISDLKQQTHRHVHRLTQSRLSASLQRLVRRLVPLANKIAQYRVQYQKLLSEALASEQPKLRTLEQRLAQESLSIAAFKAGLPAEARKRLDGLDSGAVLGQVNIAYWQKEAVSDEIMKLLKKQKHDLDNLDPENLRKALSDENMSQYRPKKKPSQSPILFSHNNDASPTW
jgi:tetratricopeptide (TPR) repeat protein